MARTQICVNRDIQGKILQRLARYWILYHIGLWSILFAIDCLRHMVFGHLTGSGPSIGEVSTKFICERWIMLVIPIMLFPAIAWDMLQLTHKVAGPLIRFQNILKQLAHGEPVEKVTLRKEDLLTEFQDAFNEFLDSGFVKNKSPQTESDPLSRDQAILDYVNRLDAELQSRQHGTLASDRH